MSLVGVMSSQATLFRSKTAALHGDLHYEPHTPGDLTDMRYWVNNAGMWCDDVTAELFMQPEQPVQAHELNVGFEDENRRRQHLGELDVQPAE